MKHKSVGQIRLLPDLPQPYEIRDWRKVAHDYDNYVFDFELKGDFLPHIWLDEEGNSFGIPSYVCAADKKKGTLHESITCVASVVGASIAGIDKRLQIHDYVKMCECYYSHAEKVIKNIPDMAGGKTGGSIWYDAYASITFLTLRNYYPGHGNLDEYAVSAADSWRRAVEILADQSADGIPDFNFTGFDFSVMKPRTNGRWVEPEGAAGAAWICMAGYAMTGEKKFLCAADKALAFLKKSQRNPTYEILMPYGVLVAARLNAEEGGDYPVEKLLDYTFNGDSYCRPGWGLIAERWGDYDCHGLVGSQTDNPFWGMDVSEEIKKSHSGYAFVTNTYSMVAALLPVVRYDKSYARDIGKLVLNTANASRLFYPAAHPIKRQTSGFWHGDPYNCLAYEGLRKRYDGHEPYATGDPIRFGWDTIDIGMYGSSHVGYMGGVIETTEVEGILRLDCVRTDFFSKPTYPTWLYFNPFSEEKTVTLKLSEGVRDVYESLSETFTHRNANGIAAIKIPASSAVLVVDVPANGVNLRDGTKYSVNGVVIDYNSTK